jgi:hypothetical protein
MRWLAELRASALVGTGRHPAPVPPAELNLRAPAGLSAEESLLDQAALADVATRAARTAGQVPDGQLPAAPPDDAPAAGGEAARLLELLLNQPPVGAELWTSLVADWLQLAANTGRRVPHALLPSLFSLAETQPGVADRLHPAIGTRGRWLQDILGPGAPSPGTVPGVEEAGTAVDLERLRTADPAAAAEKLAADWDGLGARDRATLLALLSTNLSAADEPLLERALDDKAKSVREVAAGLLDRLPESARAARMASRLRPLLGTRGMLRKRLEIDLPQDPDAAAIRDGLPPAPRSGDPDRLRWLDAIIRGAPLEVWTTAAGRDAAGTLALLDAEPRIIDAITAAAVLRGDPGWARALLSVRTDPRLLSCLPPEEREGWLLQHLRSGGIQPVALVQLLRDLPTPWGAPLAGAVLEVIARKENGYVAGMLASILPAALPPEAADECRRLLARPDDDGSRRRVLRDAVQYLSFRQSLTEAFS